MGYLDYSPKIWSGRPAPHHSKARPPREGTVMDAPGDAILDAGNRMLAFYEPSYTIFSYLLVGRPGGNKLLGTTKQAQLHAFCFRCHCSLCMPR